MRSVLSREFYKFFKRILWDFIGFCGNLGIYKKLVKKIFLTRYLVLHSLPPLKGTRLYYIGNRYIGRRVFPVDRDFHKPHYLSTELSTIHIFFIKYPQFIHNLSPNLSTDHLLLFITDQFFQSFLSS